jgi:hypothetical protein
VAEAFEFGLRVLDVEGAGEAAFGGQCGDAAGEGGDRACADLADFAECSADLRDEVAGAKLDLPNLNNAELPIELVQAILLVKSRPTLSDEETSACMAAFLAYFENAQPNFWTALRKTKRPMAYLIATVKAWADESGLDPKAFTSPTSGTTTARR